MNASALKDSRAADSREKTFIVPVNQKGDLKDR